MKKGFTIAEMLGVVIILCVIALIAFPPILNLTKNTEKDIDDATKELVITAASQYITRNSDEFTKTVNSNYYIHISDLIKEQLLSNNLLDKTSIKSDSCVNVYVNNNLKYEYNVEVECTK